MYNDYFLYALTCNHEVLNKSHFFTLNKSKIIWKWPTQFQQTFERSSRKSTPDLSPPLDQKQFRQTLQKSSDKICRRIFRNTIKMEQLPENNFPPFVLRGIHGMPLGSSNLYYLLHMESSWFLFFNHPQKEEKERVTSIKVLVTFDLCRSLPEDVRR